MTAGLAIHPLTDERLEAFTSEPGHALMLVGPVGAGKFMLAVELAERLLELPAGGFSDHPYGLVIRHEADKKQISIDAVRQMEQFLKLKVPTESAVSRVIIIEDAHLLGQEAQNALLKTLEEPPAGTVLLLTVSHAQALLPTIRSRVASVPVSRPGKQAVADYFVSVGHEDAAVNRAYAISGGLPGLMHALLTDEDHQLKLATDWARRLLSQSAYERLLSVDELSKQKQLAIDTTYILQQMARVSLQTAQGAAAARWQRVLGAAYEAAQALASNAQPKLILDELMLNL